MVSVADFSHCVEGNQLVKYCLPMDEEVFNTVALQTSGFGVAERYNPGSRAWDETWVRASASRWMQQCPAEALPWCAPSTASTGSCRSRLQEALAPCPLPTAPCDEPSQPAASILSAAALDAVPRMRPRYHCHPVPWHLPQGGARDTSQPSVEPV